MTGSRRKLMFLGLGVIAIALVIIFWKRAGSKDERDAGATGDGTGTGSTATGGTMVPSARRGDRGGTAAPDDRGDPATPAFREYVGDDGRRIRDHRTNVTGEPTKFPAPLPPEQRTMDSKLTSDLAHAIAPKVRECARDVPAGDRGAQPTIMVTVTMDVAAGTLSATDIHVAPIDVAEASGERVAACVRERTAGLTLPSGDEPDRTDYVAHFPIALR